ncbi:MAG: hypothetical protein WC876_09620 [Candidatus Thermoplasmatota archaeon]|jgi:O-antigen/teichoic acid export membrane protein
MGISADGLPVAMGNPVPVTAWQRVGHIGWTFGDQVVHAGANFLLQLVLARRLATADYGAFATANALFFLAIAAHAALVSEPMLVVGARSPVPRDEYRRALALHWGLSAVLVTLAVSALLLLRIGPRFGVAGAAAFAAALVCLLWNWLVRRACYLDLRTKGAAASSVAYAIILLIAFLIWPSTIDLVSAFWAIALAAAGATVPLHVLLLRSSRSEPGRTFARGVATSWKSYSRYGRWAILASIVAWVPLNLPLLWLAEFRDETAAAMVRAALNLSLPMLQIVASASFYLLAALSRSTPAHQRTLLRVFVLGTAILGVLWAVTTTMLGTRASTWLYGGQYDLTPALLLPIGLLALTEGLGYMVATGFRANLQTARTFWPSLGGGVALVGLMLLIRAEPVAVAWAGVAGSSATLILLLASLKSRTTRPSVSASR